LLGCTGHTHTFSFTHRYPWLVRVSVLSWTRGTPTRVACVSRRSPTGYSGARPSPAWGNLSSPIRTMRVYEYIYLYRTTYTYTHTHMCALGPPPTCFSLILSVWPLDTILRCSCVILSTNTATRHDSAMSTQLTVVICESSMPCVNIYTAREVGRKTDRREAYAYSRRIKDKKRVCQHIHTHTYTYTYTYTYTVPREGSL
jgi:hypothetical protein